MAELEEGEITDSDSEPQLVEQSHAKGQGYGIISDKKHISTKTSETSYRSRKPQHLSSDDSDNSNFSDEDTDLWRCKKAKYFSSSKAQERAMITDLPDEIQSPKRPVHKQNSQDCRAMATESHAKRKINNIWGSVLTEQSLTQGFKDVGVHKLKHLEKCDRNVEKYDFTKAYDDVRPFVADNTVRDTHDPFAKVVDLPEGSYTNDNVERGKKRKRKPTRDREMVTEVISCRDDITITEDDPEEKIISEIVILLDEPRVDLIEKIVHVAGKKKALETLYATADIESTGGMMTCNGKRRRSPGGTFFTILKTDKTLPKDHFDAIYGEEDRRYNQHRKEVRKRKKQKRKSRLAVSKMLPQAKLLSTQNKQEGEQQFNENKEESSGKSSTEEEEEEEEEASMDTNLNLNTNTNVIDTADMLDIAVGDEEVID